MVGISRHRQVVPAGDPTPVTWRPLGRAQEAEPGAEGERASRPAGTGTEAAPRSVPLMGMGWRHTAKTWRENQPQRPPGGADLGLNSDSGVTVDFNKTFPLFSRSEKLVPTWANGARLCRKSLLHGERRRTLTGNMMGVAPSTDLHARAGHRGMWFWPFGMSPLRIEFGPTHTYQCFGNDGRPSAVTHPVSNLLTVRKVTCR